MIRTFLLLWMVMLAFALNAQGQADIGLSRTLSTNHVVAGQPLTITVTMSNAGPDAATGAALTYAASDLAIVSFDVSQGTVADDQGLEAAFGTIAAGSAALLNIHAIPIDVGDSFQNINAYSTQPDPNSGNNYLYGSFGVYAGAGVFEFSDSIFVAPESDGLATITVWRLGGAIGKVSVNYATADLSALAGADYVATNGTLVFGDGEDTLSFTVRLKEDALSEYNESVRLLLFNPTGGAVLVQNTNTTLVILDNDVSFPGTNDLVSVASDPTPHPGDSNSFGAVISADGSSVAFTSSAETLVGNDNNDWDDVYLRDLTTRTTALISVNTNGTSGNGESYGPRISADGRFVAFESWASDLVPGDTNGTIDIFLRDVVAGMTRLVSANRTGNGSGNRRSSHCQMSSNGRFIVFESSASDFVTNILNSGGNIYLRDTISNVTELITVNNAGMASANRGSWDASVSDDGRFVVFTSEATDLNPAPVNHTREDADIYVRDRLLGTNILCSVATNGTSGGNSGSYTATISANGRTVVFWSYARNLTPGIVHGPNIFAYDVSSRKVQLASIRADGTGSGDSSSWGSGVSADGRFVAFYTYASDIVTNDSNGGADVFVRDLVMGTTEIVSATCDGSSTGNDHSYLLAISADGRYVLFESYSIDLVAGDYTPAGLDVFRRDLWTGTTLLISFNEARTGDTDASMGEAAISADGRSVVFHSSAPNLIPNDNNDAQDVFLWREPALTGTNASIATVLITNSTPKLLVNGSPGTSYLVQRATQLEPPNWIPIGGTNAPASGQFEFIDPAPPNGGAFYRVARP